MLLRNGRSAVDLYKRYRDVLRHEYARYTEDSRALEKFRAAESTQYFMTDCDLFAQQQIQFGRKKRRQ
uniref:Uncharacterized protein n=1 Tax=Bracon brevicornis TaxID=1563983 RepID=A0A6V7LV07_9HYME